MEGDVLTICLSVFEVGLDIQYGKERRAIETERDYWFFVTNKRKRSLGLRKRNKNFWLKETNIENLFVLISARKRKSLI